MEFLQQLIRLRTKILLFAVIITAIFFRFYLLTEIPPALYDDEAISGVEAQRALETGDFNIFYQITPQVDLGPTLRGTFGTEGLFINLAALSITLLGNEPVAIRAVSALAGVFTVLGLFLLARVLFEREPGGLDYDAAGRDARPYDPDSAGVVAAYLLAIIFWHVNFSRIGFHAILMPLTSVFSFYFLFRGFSKSGKKTHFIFSGIFLGLGFHTYIPFRIVPIVALLAIILKYIELRPEGANAPLLRKRFLAGISFFAVFAVIAFLPLLVYFIGHTDDFLYRVKGLSPFSEPDWPLKLAGNFLRALGEFNFAGDGSMRHNIAGSPQLPWAVGAFFLVGVATGSARTVSFLSNAVRGKRTEIPIADIFLIAWLLISLVPAVLAISPHPHALRSLGAVLPALVLSTRGMLLVYGAINARLASTRLKKSLMAIGMAFLILTGIAEYKRYFHDWAGSPELGYRCFDQQTYDIGRFINALPQDVNKFVIVNYRPETVQFLTNSFTESGRQRKRITYLFPEQRINIDFSKEKPYVVIPLANNEKLYRTLFENVPGRFVLERYFDYIASE